MKLFSGKGNNNSRNDSGKKGGRLRKEKEKRSGEEKREQKVKKNIKKPLLIAAGVILVLFIAFLGGSFYVNSLETIFPNVEVGGVSVGGMSKSEAADALTRANYGATEGAVLKVELPVGETLDISAEEAGVSMSREEAVDAAFKKGKDSNIFANFFTYLRCAGSVVDVTTEADFQIDSDYVMEKINESVDRVNAELMSSELKIDETEIRVIKGARSLRVNAEEVYSLVEKSFREQNYEVIKYGTSNENVDELDVEALYDAVFTEPVNAVYDKEKHEATEHENGRSFDMVEAKRLWNEANTGASVAIPLIITEPEITTDNLNGLLFRDVLGQKTTSLGGSSWSRITNITLATKAINELILNPGEEFSFNDVVGQRTAARGFQSAGAYMNGEVVSEIGGGICQVSSTLYVAAMYSNLEITNREPHMFRVAYLDAGLDATVSWGGPEFKFKNSRDYPIKIEGWVSNNSTVTLRILGTDIDGSYVQLTTEPWSSASGSGAISYRWVYDKDGNLISKSEEARSSYKSKPVPSPTPTPTPEETAETDPTVTPPTEQPSVHPTDQPTLSPTIVPTDQPYPTPTPTTIPTEQPATFVPTEPVQPPEEQSID